MVSRSERKCTPELLNEIQKAYAKKEKGCNARIARKYGISTSYVSDLASELGCEPLHKLANTRAWSAAEDQILINYADHTKNEIQQFLMRKKFRRTIYAIEDRRCLLRRRGDIPQYGMTRDHYTVSTLAEALDVYREKVARWVNKGMLKARPIEPRSNERAIEVRIEPRDVHKFLLKHIAAWSMTARNKEWLVSMIAYQHDPAALRDNTCGISSESSGGYEEHQVDA